jgi:hypothetical protein
MRGNMIGCDRMRGNVRYVIGCDSQQFVNVYNRVQLFRNCVQLLAHSLAEHTQTDPNRPKERMRKRGCHRMRGNMIGCDRMRGNVKYLNGYESQQCVTLYNYVQMFGNSVELLADCLAKHTQQTQTDQNTGCEKEDVIGCEGM